ncbi:MAG TPA: hypothetical protein PLQ81_05545, partial [bacterium]|nr:hypothetical protein [bacterium]
IIKKYTRNNKNRKKKRKIKGNKTRIKINKTNGNKKIKTGKRTKIKIISRGTTRINRINRINKIRRIAARDNLKKNLEKIKK